MNDAEIIRDAFEAARQDVYGDGGLADAEKALDRIVARLEIALSLMNRDIEGQYEEALAERGMTA